MRLTRSSNVAKVATITNEGVDGQNHMRWCIGIPTLNRADLLEEAVIDLMAHCPSHEVIIVDNGQQRLRERGVFEVAPVGRLSVLENERNMGVAGAWNQLAKAAFVERNCDAILVLNDDVVFGRDGRVIDELLRTNAEYPRLLVSARGWCSFLLPRAIWLEVGAFDERFYPAYWEDTDYKVRCYQAGKPPVIRHELSPVIYRESQTTSTKERDAMSQANAERFGAKWRGDEHVALLLAAGEEP